MIFSANPFHLHQPLVLQAPAKDWQRSPWRKTILIPRCPNFQYVALGSFGVITALVLKGLVCAHFPNSFTLQTLSWKTSIYTRLFVDHERVFGRVILIKSDKIQWKRTSIYIFRFLLKRLFDDQNLLSNTLNSWIIIVFTSWIMSNVLKRSKKNCESFEKKKKRALFKSEFHFFHSTVVSIIPQFPSPMQWCGGEFWTYAHQVVFLTPWMLVTIIMTIRSDHSVPPLFLKMSE